VDAVAIVAAAVEHRRGHAKLNDQIQDGAVAHSHVGVGKLHLSKPIVFMRVGPRDPEYKVWREPLEYRRQSGVEPLQILRAADKPRQFDIKRTSRLLRR